MGYFSYICLSLTGLKEELLEVDIKSAIEKLTNQISDPKNLDVLFYIRKQLDL